MLCVKITCILHFVVAQNTFPHFLVCGVVPLFDGPSWKLVSLHPQHTFERVSHVGIIMQIVLGYNADFDQQEKIVSAI